MSKIVILVTALVLPIISYLMYISIIPNPFLQVLLPLLNVSSYKLPSNSIDSIYDWEYIKSDKGVDVYVKQVPNSKLLAFRGVATLDMHISDIMTTFSNLTLSYEWIEMLKSIKSYDIAENKNSNYYKSYNNNDYFSSRNEDIVHQILQLPWPISPRELLLHRQWIFDEIAKSVTFNYKSIDDDRIPYKKGIIRAISPHTMWKFTSVNSNNKSSTINNKFVNSKQTKQNTRNFFDKAFHFIGKQVNNIKNNEKLKQVLSNFHSNTNNNNTFTNRKSSHTLVEIECLVDSKGGIPAWFMNYVQRSWPPKAIESFTKLSRKHIGTNVPMIKLRHW